MKAMKDADWEVSLYQELCHDTFYWKWQSFNPLAHVALESTVGSLSKRFVKQDWLKFAKLNGIKKFKII